MTQLLDCRGVQVIKLACLDSCISAVSSPICDPKTAFGAVVHGAQIMPPNVSLSVARFARYARLKCPEWPGARIHMAITHTGVLRVWMPGASCDRSSCATGLHVRPVFMCVNVFGR